MNESKTSLFLRDIPKSLKDQIEDLVYTRKKNNQSGTTIKAVATELLNAALSLPDYKKYKTKDDGPTPQTSSPNA